MIFLTGDTHGELDIGKLYMKNFKKYIPKQLTKDDYVIVLGDFGFIWKNIPDTTEEYWLKWFAERPWTTLFIDGNHENHTRLNNYPVSTWHGGKVHVINDSLIHLMRGQIFDISEKTFFTFGGALSIDKHMRQTNISWWPEELANKAEVDEAIDNIIVHDNKVDYVLTHTCITDICHILSKGNIIPDPTTNILDHFHSMLDFNQWYFGHWHVDHDFGRYTCLYNNILTIE